jgi:hypothetical protein
MFCCSIVCYTFSMREADKIITMCMVVVNVDPDVEKYDNITESQCNSLILGFFSSVKMIMSLYI